MKKRTHLLLTKKIADILKLDRKSKFWLCFGSVFPDLTPMCLLKPHRYDSRNINILSKYFSLNFSDKGRLFYFKLGVIGHYFADFFTSPHNRKGVVGFCTNHRCYETDLHKFFKDNIGKYKFLCVDDTYMDIFLCDYHSDYMKLDSSIETDFKYICNVVYELFEYSEIVCEVRNDSTSRKSRTKANGVCS